MENKLLGFILFPFLVCLTLAKVAASGPAVVDLGSVYIKDSVNFNLDDYFGSQNISDFDMQYWRIVPQFKDFWVEPNTQTFSDYLGCSLLKKKAARSYFVSCYEASKEGRRPVILWLLQNYQPGNQLPSIVSKIVL